MFELVFREAFRKSFKKLEKSIQMQVENKILNLKQNRFLGKKLTGYPYWSIHIGKFRIIYQVHQNEMKIELIETLQRKHDYRELGKLGTD